MPESPVTSKRVLVHVGPHRTGSTSIRKCFWSVQGELSSAGVHFLNDALTQGIALDFSRERTSRAEENLRELSRSIAKAEAHTILISQDDFCGELPGSSHNKSIYPKLTRNLRFISSCLQPHTVDFVFFLRDEQSWLESCYHHHLQHRFRFSSIEDFIDHFDEPLSWEHTLKRAKRIFGASLTIVPYSKDPEAGMQSILKLLKVRRNLTHSSAFEENVSPSPEKIRLLERINELSSFKGTSWFSKSLIMSDWQPRALGELDYPNVRPNQLLALAGLPSLTERASKRIVKQNVSDVMPPRDVDLQDYVFETLAADAPLPDVSRSKMEDQSRILDYHLRGKSLLAKLNALTISYLRRDTLHTDKARHLFHRIWREQGVLLVNELSTRWLISTLQTFLDHGQNESQRLIGCSGHFYANMMKIYEGERAIEGLEQDGIYQNTDPVTANKFRGLDRYSVGGTDLLLNTNALALDLAMRDDVAGLVLIELLLRVKESGNVFTRMDKTRKAKNVSVSGFTDTWSFFETVR